MGYTDPYKQQKSVSIIITTRNRPHFLKSAVESVQKETFPDYQLIVVDDNSDPQVRDQYELPPDARLILLGPDAGGCASAARNVGIAAAEGKYVAFLDDDDLWLPEKLAKQVKILDDNPEYAMTFGPVLHANEDLTIQGKQELPKLSSLDPLERLLWGNFICTPSCVLMRRDVLTGCGKYDESLLVGEDWELWVRVALRYRMFMESEPATIYRTHPGQAMQNSRMVAEWNVKVLQKVAAYLDQEHTEFRNLLRRRLASSLRRLARLQLKELGGAAEARRSICLAIRTWPYCLSSYFLYARLFGIRIIGG